MQHNPKTYVIMNEKELQSYIKELEKALILAYNKKNELASYRSSG